MSNNIKVAVILFFCLTATACSTTKTQLNRDLVQQEKISTVNLNKLNENISIELSDSGSTASSAGGATGGFLGALVGAAIDSGVNSSRKKSFDIIQGSTDVMSANMVLVNALEHNLEGSAFNEDLVINLEFDKSIKKPYLVPILTPSIIMSSNYGVMDVLLTTSTTQTSLNDAQKQNQYKGVYSSQQIVESDTLSVSKKGNKQYWIDNPVVLREKIVNGLYDVAKQFADDFNSTLSEQ